MRFDQDPSTAANRIRSYRAGEIKINDATFTQTVIVSSSSVAAGPAVATAEELAETHAAPLLELDPEVVLLGTGSRQLFPLPEFGARFLRAGIGFEVMDTAAACRTFNVLAAEQRRVVALLLP